MDKKKQKRVSPRMDEKFHDWYAARWGTTNAGAEFVLEAAPTLHQRALAEIRQKFTTGELSMILDSLNGTFQVPGLAGQHVLANVADNFALYPGQYEEKWGIKSSELLETLRGLTSFQLAALEIWAGQFWQSDRLNEDGYMEEHLGLLSPIA